MAGAVPCESLGQLKLADTTITSAEMMAAGSLAAPLDRLPAHCRIKATIRPTSDSEIKIETWMPVDGWNGKFMGVGNGGWAGQISTGALGAMIARGYAAASTDTGHTGSGGDASFALGHPEKLVDFAYRAVHEMTVKGKAIVSAYYGAPPKRSYWNGCSTGGRQHPGRAGSASGPAGKPVRGEAEAVVVIQDPKWDFRSLDLDCHVAQADRLDRGLITAMDPNLKPFFDRGGKLLQYHGWKRSSGQVQGQRQHGRCGEFCVRGAVRRTDAAPEVLTPGSRCRRAST
jgi:hypothetical protein